MKGYAIIIFFSIVFIVYFLVNYYIYRHGLMALPKGSSLRHAFVWLFWAAVICFPLGRMVERIWSCAITDFIVWVGAFWLATMLYLFLSVLFVDILRLSNLIYPWMSNLFGNNMGNAKLWTMAAVSGIALLTVTIGHINAVWTRVNHHSIQIAKDGGYLKKVRIVAASDIHMGTIIAKHRVSKLVKLINEQQPDIVLFAGDIVDEDLSPVISRNLGQKLVQINSKYGIYAITGNHEYIGGAEPAIKYLQEHGVNILRDSAALIANSFYIIGRDDKDSRRYAHQQQKELGELLNGIDRSKPSILLDHQPFHLDKVQEAGIDIQLSGHTHHGQLWPLNYITQAIFEVSSGYKKKGNSHIFVSNGYGTWGPPVRIGNRPEILVLDVEFTGENRK